MWFLLTCELCQDVECTGRIAALANSKVLLVYDLEKPDKVLREFLGSNSAVLSLIVPSMRRPPGVIIRIVALRAKETSASSA